MPAKKRFRTKYPEVFYIMGKDPNGQPERIYYIRYYRGGRRIEEKVGRQFVDDMTGAKANQVRTSRIRGDEPSNEERREQKKAAKEAETGLWTITKLWNEYKRVRTIKSLVTDQNRFDLHIKPTFGDREPRGLDPLSVDRLRISLSKKGLSPGTVKNVIELLRRIINFGVKKRLCEGPGFKVELPRANTEKTEDLDPEQLKTLLDAIEADPLNPAGPMMKLALFTGMRRGEMFKLKWEHIDFERGFILLVDPKGGKDQTIPLNQEARELLTGLPRTSLYVFPGRGGRQRVDIKRAANRIKKAAGLPKDFRALHGLRHVYASMLASSGKVDMFTLQKLLTHKSPIMTQRYAHLRDETLKRASDLAGDIVDGIRKHGQIISLVK